MENYILTVEMSEINYGVAYLSVKANSYEDAKSQYEKGNYEWLDASIEDVEFGDFYNVVSVELDEEFANG